MLTLFQYEQSPLHSVKLCIGIRKLSSPPRLMITLIVILKPNFKIEFVAHFTNYIKLYNTKISYQNIRD